MGKTKIPWADEVWNVTTGCSYASEGCTRCYAERMAKRQVAMGFARHERGIENDDTWIAYSNAINPDTGKWSGEITCRYEKLGEPLHWRKPRRVFVNSMSDLFHNDVPFSFIRAVWNQMERAHKHTFIILTKRPERMRQFLTSERFSVRGYMEPLPNVWLGVSAENQKRFDERYDYLRRTPAEKRYVSLEPLLEPINLHMSCYVCGGTGEGIGGECPVCDGTGIDTTLDLVIVGAETGPGARPMDPQWARDIRNQCKAAGVPFFFKAMSGRAPIPEDLMIREWPDG